MSELLSYTILGIVTGSVYAVGASGIVVTYATSGIFNIAHGAIGLTCATIAEAELFSAAGIKNVLWTKQPASVNNIQRTVALSRKDPTFMFVVDDPQKARGLLADRGFPFTESLLLAVEVESATDLNRLMAALLEAEVNINYLYSFIPHPQGKSILGLSMEDNEIAEQILRRHQFRVLRQADISR